MEKQKIYTIKLDGKEYISLTPMTAEELRVKLDNVGKIKLETIKPCADCYH